MLARADVVVFGVEVGGVVARSDAADDAGLTRCLHHDRIRVARSAGTERAVHGADVDAGLRGADEEVVRLDHRAIGKGRILHRAREADRAYLSAVGDARHADAVPLGGHDAGAVRAVAETVFGVGLVLAGGRVAELAAAELRLELGGEAVHDVFEVGMRVVHARVHDGHDAVLVAVGGGRVVPAGDLGAGIRAVNVLGRGCGRALARPLVACEVGRAVGVRGLHVQVVVCHGRLLEALEAHEVVGLRRKHARVAQQRADELFGPHGLAAHERHLHRGVFLGRLRRERAFAGSAVAGRFGVLARGHVGKLVSAVEQRASFRRLRGEPLGIQAADDGLAFHVAARFERGADRVVVLCRKSRNRSESEHERNRSNDTDDLTSKPRPNHNQTAFPRRHATIVIRFSWDTSRQTGSGPLPHLLPDPKWGNFKIT